MLRERPNGQSGRRRRSIRTAYHQCIFGRELASLCSVPRPSRCSLRVPVVRRVARRSPSLRAPKNLRAHFRNWQPSEHHWSPALASAGGVCCCPYGPRLDTPSPAVPIVGGTGCQSEGRVGQAERGPVAPRPWGDSPGPWPQAREPGHGGARGSSGAQLYHAFGQACRCAAVAGGSGRRGRARSGCGCPVPGPRTRRLPSPSAALLAVWLPRPPVMPGRSAPPAASPALGP